MLAVDKDFTRPKVPGDFGSGDELPVAREEQDQQLHGLAFEPDRVAVPEELEPATVEPKVAELICGNPQGTLRGRSIAFPFFERIQRFGASPKLHLRLYLRFIAPGRRIKVNSACRHRPVEERFK
jgi:hypothetical protein